MDILSEWGESERELMARADAIDRTMSIAEGVSSSVVGASGHGASSASIDELCSSLAEQCETATTGLEESDAMRQMLMECIDMVENQQHRMVLYTAMAESVETGHVQMSRLARETGYSRRNVGRIYQAALTSLEAVMREHRCL